MIFNSIQALTIVTMNISIFYSNLQLTSSQTNLLVFQSENAQKSR